MYLCRGLNIQQYGQERKDIAPDRVSLQVACCSAGFAYHQLAEFLKFLFGAF